ncbi:MAG: DUF2786 domain-containing protein [Spirochaetales bacterium]|nr:DUF2786 domain-containing protein [Spirochaetales bacterium]
MDIDTKTINRIIKLLALSKSPNAAEASSALAKAKLLLSRHGMDMGDLPGKEADIVDACPGRKGPLKPWEEKLLACISEATFTEILKIYGDEKETLRIIGKRADVITASILFEYLGSAVEKRAQMFRESIDDLESFRLGMVESIKRKFAEKAKRQKKAAKSRDRVSGEDIKRRETNRKYVYENFGDPERSDSWYNIDENSYGLGRAIGRKISVDKQISSNREFS